VSGEIVPARGEEFTPASTFGGKSGWSARSSDDHPMIAARMARADSEMIAGVQ
jgi:hypothetical protein